MSRHIRAVAITVASARMHDTTYQRLVERLGRVHVRQRLALERDYEAHVFRWGTHFFHLENWYSVHGLMRGCLRLAGLHGRGRRNVFRHRTVQNPVRLERLPAAFEGFTVLQLSDLHLDMNSGFVDALAERVQGLSYDLCVLTGDYRYRTFGPHEPAVEALARLRKHLKGEIYAVLGNHDTIRMVPSMEDMGVRVLLNESVVLKRDGATVHLAGIDDAHYYRVDNLHKAGHDIPHGACSILLSHTPETYRHAAYADFDFMLSGHTHGGQICLPGGFPLMIDADCPRTFAAGPWRYETLTGYTSVGAGASIVDVRLNCPPEITLHQLSR